MTIKICPLPNPRCWRSLILSYGTGRGPNTDYRGLMHAFTVASPQAGPLLHAPACPPRFAREGISRGVVRARAMPSLQALMTCDVDMRSCRFPLPCEAGEGWGGGAWLQVHYRISCYRPLEPNERKIYLDSRFSLRSLRPLRLKRWVLLYSLVTRRKVDHD